MLYTLIISVILFRRILFTIGWLLYKRVEAVLDSYKSGTKAAGEYSSRWLSTLVQLVRLVTGWRMWI